MSSSSLVPFHPSRIPFISKSFIPPSHADSASAFPTSSAPLTRFVGLAAITQPHSRVINPQNPTAQPTRLVGPSQPLREPARADSQAAHTSVPPGFLPRAANKPAPLVPPGFEPLQPHKDPTVQSGPAVQAGTAMQAGPSTYQLFAPNGNAAQFYGPPGGGPGPSHHHPNTWMVNMIEAMAKACDELQKEVEQLKKQSRLLGGSISWLKEDVRCYEESRTAISTLEGSLAQLTNRAQTVENSRADEMAQVKDLKEENRKLRELVGELRGDLGRVLKGVCVAGAIVGGVGVLAGVLAWVKK